MEGLGRVTSDTEGAGISALQPASLSWSSSSLGVQGGIFLAASPSSPQMLTQLRISQPPAPCVTLGRAPFPLWAPEASLVGWTQALKCPSSFPSLGCRVCLCELLSLPSSPVSCL